VTVNYFVVVTLVQVSFICCIVLRCLHHWWAVSCTVSHFALMCVHASLSSVFLASLSDWRGKTRKNAICHIKCQDSCAEQHSKNFCQDDARKAYMAFTEFCDRVVSTPASAPVTDYGQENDCPDWGFSLVLPEEFWDSIPLIRGERIFPLASVSRAHPASCTMGTGVPFPGAKARSGRDGDHSPPSSAEVKNE
jgi:hypothetical protein